MTDIVGNVPDDWVTLRTSLSGAEGYLAAGLLESNGIAVALVGRPRTYGRNLLSSQLAVGRVRLCVAPEYAAEAAELLGD
jgi:hypothetical protein